MIQVFLYGKEEEEPYAVKDNQLENYNFKEEGEVVYMEGDNDNNDNNKTWDRFIHFVLNLFYVPIK